MTQVAAVEGEKSKVVTQMKLRGCSKERQKCLSDAERLTLAGVTATQKETIKISSPSLDLNPWPSNGGQYYSPTSA